MVKTILVPVDGSDTAIRAAKFAIEEARLHQAKVIISHMDVPYIGSKASEVYLESNRDLRYAQMPHDVQKPEGTVVTDFKQDVILADAKKQLSDTKGVEVEYRRRITSRVASCLLEQADVLKADMIVMGNKGTGEFLELLMGSISTRIVNYAKCPVVIVK